jgi:nucleotide-binding universal stress UspA family protein
MYKKVLIAADNSQQSHKLAKEAVKKASIWGSEVIGLFVVDMRYAFYKSEEDFKALFKREGAKAVKFFRDLGRLFEVTVKPVVRKGIPGEEIVALARGEKADLIILGPYSKLSMSKKNLMGQTAEYAAEHAPCSVLILRS